MVHSEIMLLEIIRLYVNSVHDEPLDVENLEKAFYTLEEIAGTNLGIPLEYEFYSELEKFENICDGIINIDENQIYIEDDENLDILENQVLVSLENEDMSLDGFVSEYVYNIGLYKDLGIKPPFHEYQDILNLSTNILKCYKLLAFQEAIGAKTDHFYALLKHMVETYEKLYKDLQFEDVFQLKVILSYLSDQYLLDDDCDFINSDWYIVLFSKNLEQQKFLNYERLFSSVNEEDKEYEDELDEEEISDIPQKTTYLFDETRFFINYYTVLLNQYLEHVSIDTVKANLVLKKYMLISINSDIEEYYLQNKTIDSLQLPELKKEWLTEQSFTSLYLLAYESVLFLNVKDDMMQDDVYSDMVLRAIFIRTFLDLCINEENVLSVKNKIMQSDFYRNNDYKVANQLIDEVIFPVKGPTLSRNTCE